MAIVYKILGVVLALTALELTDAAKWGYEAGTATGPENWYKLAGNEACNKQQQSPVHIKTAETQYSPELVKFDLSDYANEAHTTNKSFKISNNGHTVTIDLDAGDFKVSNTGSLPGVFRAAQFHFHWGSDNNKGSEHVWDDKRYPMEMHIVHYDTRYSSLAEAVDKPNALAVLGWFYETVDDDNMGYKFISDYAENITYADSMVTVPAFALTKLIPDLATGKLDHYFRYQGSLTTPGCYESVIWTVFHETVKISHRQQDTLRQLLISKAGEAKVFMVDNHRPVQELHYRKVFNTVKTDSKPCTSAAAPIYLSASLIVLAVLKSFM